MKIKVTKVNVFIFYVTQFSRFIRITTVKEAYESTDDS